MPPPANTGTVGDRMLKTGGKSRTQLQHPTDRSLTSLGYWTDNGAWYHYLCSECCGGGEEAKARAIAPPSARVTIPWRT